MSFRALKLRIIKTARTVDEINKAAYEGYWPLMKPVIPSPEIQSQFAVLQHKKYGTIRVIGDRREDIWENRESEYTRAIDWTNYYPHHFKKPYAAYLIPEDIEVGERVLLEDLIEDIVHVRWNQGVTFRLSECEAIWNGKDFDLKPPHIQDIVG